MLLLARQKSNKVKSEQPYALEFGWREIETHLLLQRRGKAGGIFDHTSSEVLTTDLDPQ